MLNPNDLVRLTVKTVAAAGNPSPEERAEIEHRLTALVERRIYAKTLAVLSDLTDEVFRHRAPERDEPGAEKLYAFLEALAWHMTGVDTGSSGPRAVDAVKTLEEMIAALE